MLFPCRHSRPKKKLVDVYRIVFSLRREVFTHRPIPDPAGVVSEPDQLGFEEACLKICVSLLYLMCVLGAAIPEESGAPSHTHTHTHTHPHTHTHTHTAEFRFEYKYMYIRNCHKFTFVHCVKLLH